VPDMLTHEICIAGLGTNWLKLRKTDVADGC
jgi:hypothetical protein